MASLVLLNLAPGAHASDACSEGKRQIHTIGAFMNCLNACLGPAPAAHTDIEPIAIAAYVEELDSEISQPSVKQNLVGDPPTFRLSNDRRHSAVHAGRLRAPAPKYLCYRRRRSDRFAIISEQPSRSWISTSSNFPVRALPAVVDGWCLKRSAGGILRFW
jgi:hypothetical protein